MEILVKYTDGEKLKLFNIWEIQDNNDCYIVFKNHNHECTRILKNLIKSISVC